MKIAYFDCSSGISGDMTLGALVDAGVQIEDLEKFLRMLPVQGYELRVSDVKRCGISVKKIDVVIDESVKRAHSGLTYIRKMIEGSTLPKEIKKGSIDVFLKIGTAEAGVHGTTLEEVHFHEVGAVDSIIDIVGSVAGIALLGIEKVYSSPVNLGSGTVSCAHGVLPVPAPATAEILKNTQVFSSNVQKELTTPTGAALITSLADSFSPFPQMILKKTGYGAGAAEIKNHPNFLRLFLGESDGPPNEEKVSVIETNIDDMNPQLYEPLMETLLENGALDVFLTPIVMKKSRPAVKVTVISIDKETERLKEALLRETSTFGVRSYSVSRTILDREFIDVSTAFGMLRCKKGILNGTDVKITPEYEDVKRVAKERNIPVYKVYEKLKDRL
ncbi:MAG: nickel pincer cofactor biosynthesis protein LarC [Nitrospinota bacterium]